MQPDSTSIPYGYCHCGCGEKTPLAQRTNKTFGHVKGEPVRYLLGHHRRGATGPTRPPKSCVPYVFDPRSGCWLWQRGKSPAGYGLVNIGTKKRGAHRVIYERYRGPIPAGLYIDHLCRNPACVNPDHLEPVTNAVNGQRGKTAKLTPEKVRRIRELHEQGYGIRELARMYSMTHTPMRKVVRRLSWKNV